MQSKSSLKAIGWDATFAFQFAEHADVGLVPGRVALEHNHVYRVITAEAEWLAEAAGRIKYLASGRHELPAVGDWVGVRLDTGGGRSTIRAILPRRSQFSRKVAGRETEEQIVAANIDTVFLVSGLDRLSVNSIERYLVVARQSGADSVVILNKSDLAADPETAVQQVSARVMDVPVYAISTRTGENIDALEKYIGAGRTIALLGPSGVGKSTIVNRLVGQDVLATADVRIWDRRGRHTSVHRQLLVLERGGVLIDTPGMRELQLWEPDGGLEQAFSDIAALGTSCRFRDCRHEHEPGCAVKAAVADGTLDPARYESYLKLRREQEDFVRRQDERGQLEMKRQGKLGAKAYKALQKTRDKNRPS